MNISKYSLWTHAKKKIASVCLLKSSFLDFTFDQVNFWKAWKFIFLSYLQLIF